MVITLKYYCSHGFPLLGVIELVLLCFNRIAIASDVIVVPLALLVLFMMQAVILIAFLQFLFVSNVFLTIMVGNISICMTVWITAASDTWHD